MTTVVAGAALPSHLESRKPSDLTGSLSRSAAGVTESERLLVEVQELSSSFDELVALLRPASWADEVDPDISRSMLTDLIKRSRRIRTAVRELSTSAEQEMPIWSDPPRLQEVVKQLQSKFVSRRSDKIRGVYLRVASELSTATVDHPSPRIRQTLEQLIQESLSQLYEVAERELLPEPPIQLQETGWWRAVQLKKENVDVYAAAVQPYSSSLADLIYELPRLRFVEESGAIETAAPMIESEVVVPTSSPAMDPALPPETARTNPKRSTPTADGATKLPHDQPVRDQHTNSSPIHPIVQCPHCAHSDPENLVRSRMRLVELPWLLIRQRAYRCLSCNTRFFSWL